MAKGNVAHQDVLSLLVVSDLNPDSAVVRDVLEIARSIGVERLSSDGVHADVTHVYVLGSNVDTVGVVLGVAWLKGHGSVRVVIVEVEGLG